MHFRQPRRVGMNGSQQNDRLFRVGLHDPEARIGERIGKLILDEIDDGILDLGIVLKEDRIAGAARNNGAISPVVTFEADEMFPAVALRPG
jgi:hypothetical protein